MVTSSPVLVVPVLVVAFVIAQGLALMVFALIVALCLFFIRLRGVSLDQFFDGFAPGGG